MISFLCSGTRQGSTVVGLPEHRQERTEIAHYHLGLNVDVDNDEYKAEPVPNNKRLVIDVKENWLHLAPFLIGVAGKVRSKPASNAPFTGVASAPTC